MLFLSHNLGQELNGYRKVGTQVNLRDDLVDEVDKRVGRGRRSKFVNKAVEERLMHIRQIEFAEAAGGALKDVDIPGWETEESTLKWVRKLRDSSDPSDNEPNPKGC